MQRHTSGRIWVAASIIGLVSLAVGILVSEWLLSRVWGSGVPLWVSVVFWSIVCVVVLTSVVGIPLGIFLMRRTTQEIEQHLASRIETQHITADERRLLATWSWTAFFGAPLWAFGSRLYGWGVLSLIPGLHVIAGLVLGARGRREAWKEGEWKTFAEFWQRQKLLRPIVLAAWAVVVLVLGVFWFLYPIRSKYLSEACVQEIDTDGDLVTDFEETELFMTNPNKKDSDGDGQDDFAYLFEVGFARIDVSDLPDTDNDGVKDILEQRFFETDPEVYDMDGDGYPDGTEIHFGYDPKGPGISPDWRAVRLKRLAEAKCS